MHTRVIEVPHQPVLCRHDVSRRRAVELWPKRTQNPAACEHENDALHAALQARAPQSEAVRR